MTPYTHLKAALCLALLLLLSQLNVNRIVAAQEAEEPIVASYSLPSVTVDDVMRGEPGEVYFVYYLPAEGPERPALVARITKKADRTDSVAEVYDTSPDAAYVPIEFMDGYPSLPSNLTPTIILTAIDGWWVRDGIVNYNLDITVYGRVYAMWGADNTLWTQLLQPTDPNAHIMVRDTDRDGIPDWDWRTMLPEFPNRGDLRTSYAERKCDTPLSVELGVSSQWPFVAYEGGSEQPPTNTFRPPIVVNWATGQIRFFSELVTVRNQNCSYSLYSIKRILLGQLNSPNFETPFAFYDLSNEGIGHPNLLLRTVRTTRNDRSMFVTGNPETQGIRYSWRNAIGDWEWDYKVDVLGQHQFDYETSIASNTILIDAPPYEAYPGWVIERQWPASSFVAMEQTRYKSSEGIYEWPMLGLLEEYYYGWKSEPSLHEFEDIRTGLRGEYRIRSTHSLETYFSPIDNRLHLKWAEHGIWRLD
ncbi:MAG: hypothetical protein H3C69_08570, partial [Candidatus Promineofilum sp.]|nr:hypothetical protein [Promineifilum sp.]